MAISLTRKRMMLKVVKMTNEELKRELREVKRALRSLETQVSILLSNAEQKPLLTLREVAVRLNRSYSQTKKLVKDGELNCTIVGKRKMFTEKNISDYLQG